MAEMTISVLYKCYNRDMPKGIYTRKIPVSKETREKLSKLRKGNTNGFKKGAAPHNKGILSPWVSKRNREVNPLRRGDKSPHWKGGTYGTERHRLMSQSEYKQWRSDVFKRDNWTCQTCQARGVYLEAHHIKSWSKYPELRYELSNGVTLCKECHNLITFSKNK